MPSKRKNALEEKVDLPQGLFAHLLYERNSKMVKFDHQQKMWFIRRKGENWKRDEVNEIILRGLKLATEIGSSFRNSTTIQSCKYIESGVKLLSCFKEVRVSKNYWDQDDYLIGVPSGTIDLKYSGNDEKWGQVRKARSEERISMMASVDPAEDEDCPIFKGMVNQIAGGRDEVVCFLKRYFGSCLTGDTTEQKFLILQGAGRNGKGVVLRSIAAALGDYHNEAATSAIIETRGSPHPTDVMDIVNCRFLTLSEIVNGARWREDVLKKLTGSDDLKARKILGDFSQFTPRCKLCVLVNPLPSISLVGPAISGRIVLLRIGYSVKEEMRDRSIGKEIKQNELPGVMRWLLNGCRDWQKVGLQVPECLVIDTQRYVEAQDIFGQFLAEKCVLGFEYTESSRALLEAWNEFLKNEEMRPESAKRFSNRLVAAGYTSTKVNGQRSWSGLALKEYLENA